MSLLAALTSYYTEWVDCRYSYLYARISRNVFGAIETTLEEFVNLTAVYFTEQIAMLGLLGLMGEAKNHPGAIASGIEAFAKYIFYRL